MAQSYDRRINLYVNIDGKEVSNNVRSINAEMNKLKNGQKNMIIGSAEYNKEVGKINQLKSILNQHRENLGQLQTPLQKVVGWAKSLLPAFGFAALASGIKSIFTNVIQVRKEFEKYEAVLTNTLGSNKKARQEMQMLQKFAAETPFALTELTGSFVKLTNYGLKPTRDEMRKYGDLASSVGKGFDQLAEGVADAVTGEFERLKEFGIKAKKEGDKITFTFKEQSTVVDNNAASIKNYIIGLGDLQGVSGSMAAISETLGGKISNMGDAWDGLMNTMGGKSSGIFVTIISWMTSFVNTLDNALKSVQMIKEAVKDQSAIDAMNNAIVEIDVMEKSLVRNGMAQAEAHDRAIMLYNKSMSDGIKSANASRKEGAAAQKEALIQERDLVNNHFKMLDDIKKKQKGAKAINPKAGAENEDLATKALDQGYKQQQLWLKERYQNEETLQKEYHARMLANELAYLEAKAALTTDDSTYLDLQSQIIDKQNEYNAALKETVPELLNTHDGTEKLNTRLLEEAKLLGLVVKKQAEAADATEALKVKTESQRDMILATADALAQSVYDLASGGEDALREAGKNILLFALDMLKTQTEIAIAGATIQSLAQPDSVATFGATGLIRAAILVGLIEVAFAGVKGLVNNALTPKKGKATGYASGGFTDGERTYTAGEAGPEWISPNWMIKHPLTAPIIASLESWRKNPVTVSSGAIATTETYRTSSFSPYSSSPQTIQKNFSQPESSKVDIENLNKAINLNTRAVALLMQNGVRLDIVTIKKNLDLYSDLINQTGMLGFKKK